MNSTLIHTVLTFILTKVIKCLICCFTVNLTLSIFLNAEVKLLTRELPYLSKTFTENNLFISLAKMYHHLSCVFVYRLTRNVNA